MLNYIYKNKCLVWLAMAVLIQAGLLSKPLHNEEKFEKVTFLGVYSTDVSPTLTHQLGFPEGFYLTIQQVEHESPADEAGLQKHDILQKIDDQIIINAEQLRELIRSKESGVNVGITYFRGGHEHTASAKLTTRKVTTQRPMQNFRHEFMPKDFHFKSWPKEFNQPPKSFKFDFDTDLKATGPRTKTFTMTNDESSVQINDDHGSLALDMKGEIGQLTIRNKDGKTLYDGEYKVGQKMKDVPEHWQKRLSEIDNQLKKQHTSKENSKSTPKERLKQKKKE